MKIGDLVIITDNQVDGVIHHNLKLGSIAEYLEPTRSSTKFYMKGIHYRSGQLSKQIVRKKMFTPLSKLTSRWL